MFFRPSRADGNPFPNYNGRELAKEPNLWPFKKVRIVNAGAKRGNRLAAEDNVPKDFHEW
jgi:hypothetical protein